MALSILSAINEISKEKGLSKEQILQAIEQALAAAYRKDFGEKNQNIKVKFDPSTGAMDVWDEKNVVEDFPEEDSLEEESNKKINIPPDTQSDQTNLPIEEEKKRFNPKTEIQISDAKKINKKYKIGDLIKTKLEIPNSFGRIATQTAKQVIIQRLRETEREIIYDKYKALEGKVISAVIQRRERQNIIVDLEDTSAILPLNEQVFEEKYWPGEKIKVYILIVNKTPKGPQIILSRRHPDIVKELFKLDIPEITNNQVIIKNIVREAGARCKIAVTTKEKGIDPIGACIGQRGIRIQTIIGELGGEKIDVVEYSDKPKQFIANALAPAKIIDLEINKKTKSALAKVKRNQLSLAIGKAGQNVRLASKLTGWKIDIQQAEEKKEPELKKDVIKKEDNKETKKENEKSLSHRPSEEAKKVTEVLKEPKENDESKDNKKEEKEIKKQ